MAGSVLLHRVDNTEENPSRHGTAAGIRSNRGRTTAAVGSIIRRPKTAVVGSIVRRHNRADVRAAGGSRNNTMEKSRQVVEFGTGGGLD